MKTLRQKFDEKHIPVTESGCWLWIGSMFSNGYGAIYHFKTMKAHRISWKLNRGEIPNGLCVCHKCDTPSCVNPDHLFVGTTRDNVADREAKGRGNFRSGEGNPKAKLTHEEVLQIRKSGHISHEALGKIYGVGRTAIAKIMTGVNW